MRVAAEEAGVLFWIIGFQGVKVRGKGNLGIDDDVAATGQIDEHVRADDAPAQWGGDLAIKVHVFGHTAELNHALQLHLAPTAAHIG